jgi:hypothetical protein
MDLSSYVFIHEFCPCRMMFGEERMKDRWVSYFDIQGDGKNESKLSCARNSAHHHLEETAPRVDTPY